jgi:hypothetical protein
MPEKPIHEHISELKTAVATLRQTMNNPSSPLSEQEKAALQLSINRIS